MKKHGSFDVGIPLTISLTLGPMFLSCAIFLKDGRAFWKICENLSIDKILSKLKILLYFISFLKKYILSKIVFKIENILIRKLINIILWIQNLEKIKNRWPRFVLILTIKIYFFLYFFKFWILYLIIFLSL